MLTIEKTMAIDICSHQVFGSDLQFLCGIFWFVKVVTDPKSQKLTASVLLVQLIWVTKIEEAYLEKAKQDRK